MIQKIIQPFSLLLFAAVLFFAFGTTAFAYNNLEIEIEVENEQTEAEVKFEDEEDEEVELEFTYETTDLDDVYEMIVDDLVDYDEDLFAEITADEVEDAVAEIVEEDEDEEEEDEDEDEEEEDEDEDEDEEEEDEDEDEDEEDEDENRGHGNDDDRCDGDNPGKSRLCDNKHDRLDRLVQCRVDMLRDGERDRMFCRNGEWKERREARLKDITDGFISTSELSDEEKETIKEEVRALINELIALMLRARGL